MPFLRPFGQEILAGPLMTAACMAATIPVLARIGRRLGLGRGTTFLVCLAFAVTPDMVYTASNGMAESCFILSGAVAMLGFLTWIDGHRTTDLLVFTLGLSMLAMTRLEGPFMDATLVVVAAFDLRHRRRALWDAAVLALPPAACYGFWMLIQWVLLGDPLFYLHQSQPGGPGTGPAENPFWLPANMAHHPVIALHWVLGWVAVLAPILFLLAASILAAPITKRLRGTVGILGAMGTVLAIQMDLGLKGGAFGDPRYFVMAVIFGAVAALWMASGRRGVIFRAWNLGLVGLLVVGAGTGSYALTSGRVTHEENECAYFQYGVARVLPFLGRAQHGQYGCHPYGDGLASWQQADHWIDSHLRSRDRVVADNASDYAAELFTTRPGLFIVRNDRDWAKTIAYPSDVTYVITQSTNPSGLPVSPPGAGNDSGAQLIYLDQAGWHLAAEFGGGTDQIHQGTWVQVWRFTPSPQAGATPTGTEANV